MEFVKITGLQAGDLIRFRVDAPAYTVRSIRKCVGAPSTFVIYLVEIEEGITVPESMEFVPVSMPRIMSVRCILCGNRHSMNVDIASVVENPLEVCEKCDRRELQTEREGR